MPLGIVNDVVEDKEARLLLQHRAHDLRPFEHGEARRVGGRHEKPGQKIDQLPVFATHDPTSVAIAVAGDRTRRMEQTEGRLTVAAEAVENRDSRPLVATCKCVLNLFLFLEAWGHAGNRRKIRRHEAPVALERIHLAVDRGDVLLEAPLAFVCVAKALGDVISEPAERVDNPVKPDVIVAERAGLPGTATVIQLLLDLRQDPFQLVCQLRMTRADHRHLPMQESRREEFEGEPSLHMLIRFVLFVELAEELPRHIHRHHWPVLLTV